MVADLRRSLLCFDALSERTAWEIYWWLRDGRPKSEPLGHHLHALSARKLAAGSREEAR